jgi:hypothetical protein
MHQTHRGILVRLAVLDSYRHGSPKVGESLP